MARPTPASHRGSRRPHGAPWRDLASDGAVGTGRHPRGRDRGNRRAGADYRPACGPRRAPQTSEGGVHASRRLLDSLRAERPSASRRSPIGVGCQDSRAPPSRASGMIAAREMAPRYSCGHRRRACSLPIRRSWPRGQRPRNTRQPAARRSCRRSHGQPRTRCTDRARDAHARARFGDHGSDPATGGVGIARLANTTSVRPTESPAADQTASRRRRDACGRSARDRLHRR